MSTPNPENLPEIIFDSGANVRLRLQYQIGTFLDGTFPVYRAAVILETRLAYHSLDSVEDIFVAVKAVAEEQNQNEYHILKREVDINNVIPRHENLIHVQRAFFFRGHFCVTFPYMSIGTMRNLLRTRFRSGMPEDCILVILRETLTGLSHIHENGIVHGKVNAGNIFVKQKPEIKLAFAATVYTAKEERHMPSSSSSLPADEICTWAAAPEAHWDPRLHSEKSDIWMIGITALELACGGLVVRDRDELESVVRKINKKGIIPNKEDKKKKNYLCLGLSGNQSDPVTTTKVFSEEFQKMVARCLEIDPSKRPEASEILQMDIFLRPNMSVQYCYDTMASTPEHV